MRFRMLVGACAFALFAAGCAQTDTGITTAVKNKLIADDLVKARQINVDTQDKVVTLTGEVTTPEEETRALQIARGTEGVLDVIDQISIVPPQATGFGVTPDPTAIPPAGAQ
jgi:hyperosmotically inducible periplasmic protein